VHVRGIVITCDVLIQSERVNTILKYREYRATSMVTEPAKAEGNFGSYLLRNTVFLDMSGLFFFARTSWFGILK